MFPKLWLMRWSVIAVLRKIVGTDLFGAIAGADLRLRRMLPMASSASRRLRSYSMARSISIAFSRFCICERSCCEATTMPVGTCVMRIADSVLLTYWPPAPLRFIGVDLQIARIDLDVDLLVDLRQNRDRGGAGVDAALRFGQRHALHAVDARLVFEVLVRIVALYCKNDFLIAACIARALGDEFDAHALRFSETHVHARQISGKNRRFVAAGAGANFDEHVFVVVRIFRDHQHLQALFQIAAPFAKRLCLFFR